MSRDETNGRDVGRRDERRAGNVDLQDGRQGKLCIFVSWQIVLAYRPRVASESGRTAHSRERDVCTTPPTAERGRPPASVAQRKINELTRKYVLLVRWPAPRAAMDYGEGRRGGESRTLVRLLFALAPWVSDKI